MILSQRGRALPKQSKSTPPASGADTDAAIRARAYHLWETDGRPDGRAEHYWHMAKSEAAPVKPKRQSATKGAGPKATEKKAGKKAKA